MKTIYYPLPPKVLKQKTDGEIVALPEPEVLPKKAKQSLVSTLMPIVQGVLVVSLMLMMLWMGLRQFSPMVFTPMIMMISMLLHSIVAGSGNDGELNQKILDWFYKYRQELKKVHHIGADLYADLLHRHPHPRLLAKMVGGEDMWSSQLTRPGGVSSWSKNENAREMVIARIGLGLTAFPSTKFRTAKAQIEENIEPITAAAFRQFNRVQPFLVNAPFEFQWSGNSLFQGGREKVLGTVRALICQAAFHYDPATVSIIVITDDEEQWKWVGKFPHLTHLIHEREKFQDDMEKYSLIIVDNPSSPIPQVTRGGNIIIRAEINKESFRLIDIGE